MPSAHSCVMVLLVLLLLAGAWAATPCSHHPTRSDCLASCTLVCSFTYDCTCPPNLCGWCSETGVCVDQSCEAPPNCTTLDTRGQQTLQCGDQTGVTLLIVGVAFACLLTVGALLYAYHPRNK